MAEDSSEVKLAEEFENELHISSEEAKVKASHVYVKVLMRMMSPICPIDGGVLNTFPYPFHSGVKVLCPYDRLWLSVEEWVKTLNISSILKEDKELSQQFVQRIQSLFASNVGVIIGTLEKIDLLIENLEREDKELRNLGEEKLQFLAWRLFTMGALSYRQKEYDQAALAWERAAHSIRLTASVGRGDTFALLSSEAILTLRYTLPRTASPQYWNWGKFLQAIKENLQPETVVEIQQLHDWVESDEVSKLGGRTKFGGVPITGSFNFYLEGFSASIFCIWTDGSFQVNYSGFLKNVGEEITREFHKMHGLPLPRDAYSKPLNASPYWLTLKISDTLVGKPEAVEKFKNAIIWFAKQVQKSQAPEGVHG